MLDSSKENEIKQAIVRTIAFFDLFDYPLTLGELFFFFPKKISFTTLSSALENLEEVKIKEGFCFLKDRENIIEIRQRRYNYAQKKIALARKVSWFFKLIPTIKLIAVSNIIGFHNLKKESDIDLFIITKKNRIWVTRFLTVLITKFLNVRPKPENHTDKICLSFFISESALNLENLALEQDPYFYYWFTGLKPIYEKNKMFKKFLQENLWIEKYLPNWKDSLHLKTQDFKKPKKPLWIFNIFEWLSRKIQLKMLPSDIKKDMNKNLNVIVSDKILKFHTNDRRYYYFQKWLEKTKTYEILK